MKMDTTHPSTSLHQQTRLQLAFQERLCVLWTLGLLVVAAAGSTAWKLKVYAMQHLLKGGRFQKRYHGVVAGSFSLHGET